MIKNKKGQISYKVLIALGFSILFWASAFVGIRSSLETPTQQGYSPQALALLRFLSASAFLVIYAFIVKLRIPKRRDWWLFIITGFTGIFGYHILLNIGEKTVTAGTAGFIIGSIPIFTGLLSLVFLKERFTLWGWFGILISFIGIGMISLTEGEFGNINWGALLVLFAALLGGLNVIIQRVLLKYYTALEVATYSIWMGTLFLLIFITDLFNELPEAPIKVTIEVVYLGIFPAAIAFILWAYALQKFTLTAHATSFLYLTPIVTLFISWFWIGEVPGVFSILGGFVILGGVVFANTKGKA